MTHESKTRRMLLETWTITALLTVANIALLSAEFRLVSVARILSTVATGAWLMRHYVVSHEATHRVLFPKSRRCNDVAGQLLVLPLLLPLRVYRKIHRFHHAHNRRDHQTAALDTYVVNGPVTRFHRWAFGTLWIGAVFAGGFFFHGVISVLFFVVLPLSVARKISPAFKGWSQRDRWASLGVLVAGLALHLGVALGFGAHSYFAVLGYPVLVFAVVYSIIVYIYHYGTTYGDEVRFHARTLDHQWFFSWWLINFNEHATHHRDPRLPWHALPENRQPLPAAFAGNQNVNTLFHAVLNLLNGPTIVSRKELGKR